MRGNIKCVRTKILACFLLGVAITAAVGVVGSRGMADIEDDAAAIYDENLVPVTALGAVEANLHKGQVYALIGILTTPTPEILEVQEQTAAEVTSALEAYDSSDPTPRKREAPHRFEEAYTPYSANGTDAQEQVKPARARKEG